MKLILFLLIWACASSAANLISVIAPLAKITSKPGSHSTSQPLNVLEWQEQSGDQNDWDTYVEFYTTSRGYSGLFDYNLPTGIQESNVVSMNVLTNYLGPQKSYQRWMWSIYDHNTNSWVFLGDNAGAPDWEWKFFDFSVPGNPTDFIDGNGKISLRYKTNSGYDNSDLDLLSVEVGIVAPAEPTTDPTPPTGTIWQPKPGTTWQWQISDSAIDTSFDVDMYDIDLFEVDQSTIDQLHLDGRIVVCYFSAGSYEDWRPDASDFPSSILGNPLDSWPGERWLDIGNIEALGPIMQARLDLAVNKNCDGVEPDNIDGYINNNGLGLTSNEQIIYNRWLAQQAHQRGLSIGLKNDLDQVNDLVNDFDWALNEQCWQYNECDLLTPFVAAGKAVFGVEYRGVPATFCPVLNAMQFSWLKKNLDLDAFRIDCQDY
jgi:hypothetical protein